MAARILVFYGSYRSDRMGIRLAYYVVAGLGARGADVELVDAKAIGLPMLDRMFKEYPPGGAPEALATLAAKIRAADAASSAAGATPSTALWHRHVGPTCRPVHCAPQRVPWT
jgi:NAD(P)H-dependent FMN reductase